MTLSRLRRIRWAVRTVLVLGVAASVTANVLHARDNPISQVIAAWPPLALLLTVELISRVPVHRRSLAVARLAATVAIAGIAAWVSYWHMAGVVARYGETGATPYLMPFSVDGLVIVASVCLVELAGRIRVAEQPSPKPAIDDQPAKPQAQDSPAKPAASPVAAPTVPATPDNRPDTEPASTGQADSVDTTPARVARARAADPTATRAELAERLSVSERTVRRYDPASSARRTQELVSTR